MKVSGALGVGWDVQGSGDLGNVLVLLARITH